MAGYPVTSLHYVLGLHTQFSPVTHCFSMFILTRFFVLCSLGFALVFSTGCDNAGRLSGLVPARGVVLYKNAPVEGATLTFFPEDAVSSAHSVEQRPATAVTDASGRFVMMTLQPDDGVFPGQYSVVITKNIPQRVFTREELQEFFRQGRPTPIPEMKNELPEQYSDPKTSPLKVDLNSKGDKALKFELVDSVE